jgi:hypothetical protein
MDDAAGLNIDPSLIEEVLEGKATTRGKRRPPDATRYIGAPLSFVRDVCRKTDGRTALLVALLIYRRTCVCGSRTVTLPNKELIEVGLNRQRKQEAMARLQSGGLIRVKAKPGQTAKITLRWRPTRSA